jgi:hypothetical protein
MFIAFGEDEKRGQATNTFNQGHLSPVINHESNCWPSTTNAITEPPMNVLKGVDINGFNEK